MNVYNVKRGRVRIVAKGKCYMYVCVMILPLKFKGGGGTIGE